MKFQSFIREELDLMSVQQVADALGYKVNAKGTCRQLERIVSKKYCKERGYNPLPYYFSGSKMMVEKQDLMEWIKQFKK